MIWLGTNPIFYIIKIIASARPVRWAWFLKTSLKFMNFILFEPHLDLMEC